MWMAIVASTCCLTIVLIANLRALHPIISRLCDHREMMRLRDLQAQALSCGYEPLKLDPNYVYEEEEHEEDNDEQEEREADRDQPGVEQHSQYVQGYQGQRIE